MNRPIKFRYIWRYKDDSGFKTEYKTLDEIEGEDCWQGQLPYTLESRDESTGLTDKNGKEIYEGDIVRNENDKKPNQKIVFTRGMFCLDDEDSPLWRYTPQDFWEVIGNIYENKELLDN